jgi:mxaL protein
MTFSHQTRIIVSSVTMIIALVLIMAALWLPKVERNIKVMDLLFVIDITQSMNVQDARHDDELVTRIDWAKAYAREMIAGLPCGTHTGLAVFSESRSLLLMNPVEVCENYHDITQMLAKIDGTMAWAQSSEVSKAVFTAIKSADLVDPAPSIVFVTDGHESPPVHDTLFPKFRGTPGEVTGVFVGVGGEDLLPIPKRDDEGKSIGFWGINEVLHRDVYMSGRADLDQRPRTEHLSSQKKSHLESLAAMVGFDYVESPEKAKTAIKALKTTANAREQLVNYDLSPWLAGIALFLLMLVYLPFQFGRNR